ncbi:MAG: XshC-Cox1-family protein [Microbacterium sp.]|uniref:Putative xanthine dehydrogenase subunit A n=2 Tax=Microbacterium TaxID=33882 RepID=A0A0F0LXD5_9MICO|nr:XdhC/CoxI family protein [Microbacterium ginsengisoli]KJL36056.1 putative xanthine dehydrogenase subunit A [Microbacterium ginsengisoli]MAL07678.1 XshC-Cox1-family protein [Microbacterium sp.]MBN9207035.1 XdhC family protein [Microbacterium ginsengisoli]HAN25235.1 XshC-Cox1-family protein [Microbacterium ginsengisoli]
MLELATDLLPLLAAGERVAVVTVAHVARSAPRGAGAAMAITSDARAIGSISGGCVEADAVALALSCLATGRGQTARFGFTDEQAYAAGLACGGSIEAVVSVLDPADTVVRDALERVAAGRRAAVGIVAAGPDTGRILPLDAGGSETRLGEHDGCPVLAVVQTPPPALYLLGAGEHAAALCRVAAAAGFAVTVCDAWELLATRERFPAATRIVVDLPHDFLATLDPVDLDDRTAICVLTHDERLDVPALEVALRLPVGFVGAMGARSTVAHRATRLREAGLGDDDLARLHSPLGLDLGGRTPEETALSVLAEIVAARHGGSAVPLRERGGAIHARAAADTMLPTEADAAASACALPALATLEAHR